MQKIPSGLQELPDRERDLPDTVGRPYAPGFAERRIECRARIQCSLGRDGGETGCIMKNETATTPENTVFQALAKGTCPICTLVRTYQNETIERFSSAKVQSVCNYHAWAIAASSPAGEVVKLFLYMLEHAPASAGTNPEALTPCDLCTLLREHELTRLQEFAREMRRKVFLEWIERHGTVCRFHGKQLIAMLPQHEAAVIASLVAHNEDELKESLRIFMAKIGPGKHAGGGILGRVAEFLVAQRGLTR